MRTKIFAPRRLPLVTVTALSVLAAGCSSINATSTYTPYADKPIQPITNAPFPVPDFKRPSFPDQTFNVLDYGADTTGTKKSTEAFAKAVAAAKKAGGGKILVPAGNYLTGPIQITNGDGSSCDNIDLHVEKDADIKFSADFKDYLPAVLTRWEGMDVMNYSPQVFFQGLQECGVDRRRNTERTGLELVAVEGQHVH